MDNTKCRKCGGNLITDYGRIYCVQCGRDHKTILTRPIRIVRPVMPLRITSSKS